MSTTHTDTDEQIDRLLRAASRRLHNHLELAPQTSLPAVSRRQHEHRLGLIAVAMLAVAAIAGLIVVTSRHHQITPAASDVGPRWVVTDLPEGWGITHTVGPGGDPYVNPALETIYGTSSAPAGALLQVASSGDPTSNPTSGINTEIRAGRETILTTGSGGQRLLYVKTPLGWTRLSAVELDEAALVGLASAVVLNERGDASISPDRVPAGMHLIISDTLSAIAPTVADGLSNDPGVGTRSDYEPPADQAGAGMTMATAPATPSELLWLRLNTTSLGDAELDSGTGQLLMGVNGENFFHSLYWQRDGLAFLLFSPALNDLQLVAAANSAQPADPSAWARLGGDQVIPSGDTIPAIPIPNG